MGTHGACYVHQIESELVHFVLENNEKGIPLVEKEINAGMVPRTSNHDHQGDHPMKQWSIPHNPKT
jgi:hypothetical protein